MRVHRLPGIVQAMRHELFGDVTIIGMSMIHDYDEAIAYLERLIATPVQNAPGAGLERARLMLAHLGDPQARFTTLHVTGSSGKGSTTTLAAAMLRAAGYRVGTFTSPHLVEYTERIAVDGEPISHAGWTRLLNRLRPFVEQMAANALPGYTLGRPALLQVLWPMAALYFAECGVDVAVVEVGMGGRYDSTNANNARVAVVTNVSLEHTRYLGATIEAIAAHKAGVAKPGGILVTAAQHPAALAVIAAECARQGTTLWRVAPEGGEAQSASDRTGSAGVLPIPAGRQDAGAPGGGNGPAEHFQTLGGEVTYRGDSDVLCVETPAGRHDGLRLGPLGPHQRTNAACAVAAVDALRTLSFVEIGEESLRRALAETQVPGRLERVAEHPSTLLDGAHNADAARTLAVALRDLFPARRLVLLLGILGDKDIAAMADALAPLAAAVIVTEPPWEGRMGHGEDVARAARRHLTDVTYIPDVPEALAAAQRRARELDAPLVVTGSMILVGAVRPLLLTPRRP